MERTVVEKIEIGIDQHDNRDDSIELKGDKMLPSIDIKEKVMEGMSTHVSSTKKKRKGTNVCSPSKVKKETDCKNEKDSIFNESEKVQESINTNSRSLTKTKFPLEDNDEVAVVSVPKESVVIHSPAVYASGSHTKIKLPLEDDDMVVTFKSVIEKCRELPWWYNATNDINDDFLTNLKK
jgi:hypothetical protein